MALVAGDKLGPYEILAPIGAGGMGDFSAIPPRGNQQNLPDDVDFAGLGASSR
jgi:hypothetical protein